MRIPVYNREVSVNPTLTSGGPDIPMPNESSSGVNVAKAQERAGLQAQQDVTALGSNVVSHMQKRAYERNVEMGDDEGNKLDDFATDFMLGQGSVKKTIKDDMNNDKEVEIPRAVLGRSGYDAVDIGFQTKKALFDRKQIVLEKLKSNPDATKKFLERYDSIEKAAYKTALTHELAETRNGARNTLMATVSKELSGINAVTNIDDLKKRVDTRFDTAVESGLLTFEQAKIEKDEARDELFRSDVKKYDTATMTKRINDNYYGWTDNKRIDTALSNLNHFTVQQERDIAKQKDDKEDSIIKDELNGKYLDDKDIVNLMNAGQVDVDWAESKIKSRLSTKDVKTDPAVYEELKNMIVGGAKSIDIKRAIEKARGTSISSSDADSLYYVKQEGKDTSVYQAYYDDTHKEDSWWTAAINSLSKFAQDAYGIASPALPGLINKFVSQVKTKGVAKEAFPDVALQVIKAKVIEDNPSISNLKDVPNAKFSKDGFQPLLEGKNEVEPNYVFRGGKLVPNKKTE